MQNDDTLFNKSSRNFYTIEAGRPFLRDLAAGIHAASKDENGEASPLALAEFEIYLPTRRAMRTLATELIAQSPHKTSLLPRIRAIGALDDDVVNLAASFSESADFDNGTLPPAISTMERRLVLAFLIASHNAKFSGEQNWATALGAADELGKLLDSFYTEEIPFSSLDKLTPDNSAMAKHWEVSQQFLSIVTTSWPNYLQERGYLDPTDRRIKLIHRAIEYFQANPPQNPVIIAGSTGSTPAVAELMRLTQTMPQACVILPGLDKHLDKTGWHEVDDSHAQAGLKALLKRLELERDDIKSWPFHHAQSTQQSPSSSLTVTKNITPRNTLMSLALRPANATNDWLNQIKAIPSETLEKSVQGLKIFECHDENHEATTVSILIRRILENPNETVMLVTPDRDLTRRVSAKLNRWNIKTDDSGGTPFQNTACGTFLRLVSQWLIEPSNPVSLLAMIRHPMCVLKSGDITKGRSLAILDKALRGLTPANGILGIRQKIQQYYSNRQQNKTQTNPALNHQALDIDPLIEWLETAYRFWEEALYDIEAKPSNQVEVSKLLQSHLRAAEFLSAGDDEHTLEGENTKRLWQHEDGKTGSMVMSHLMASAHLIAPIPFHDYADIFSQLIIGETVRLMRPTHPRVFILGPLEARLQSADHIILGGLNESMWPGDAMVDGFLSHRMRADINLPSPERRIGLSAHDFFQLASKKRVTLTRAQRSNNAPATPSRWLVRLNNILKGTKNVREDIKFLETVRDSDDVFSLTHKLDHASTITPTNEPKPCPPIAARPKKLSVTRIEKWLRDPYFIYARYILKLKKLDFFNDEFGSRHIGNIIHKVFEGYAKTYQSPIDDEDIAGDRLKQLNRLLADQIQHHALTPTMQTLWQPAFDKSLLWFEQWHEERLKISKPIIIEEKGTWAFTPTLNIKTSDLKNQNPEIQFTLEATADRIDLRLPQKADGIHETHNAGVDIIDYKTGTLPSIKQGKTFNPQLSLTGLIVQADGFDGLNTKNILSQTFIKTLNRKSTPTKPDKKDNVSITPPDIEETLIATKKSLFELILSFNNEDTPYLSQPRSEFTDQYADYDHLARRAEWAAENDDQDHGDGS